MSTDKNSSIFFLMCLVMLLLDFRIFFAIIYIIDREEHKKW